MKSYITKNTLITMSSYEFYTLSILEFGTRKPLKEVILPPSTGQIHINFIKESIKQILN